MSNVLHFVNIWHLLFTRAIACDRIKIGIFLIKGSKKIMKNQSLVSLATVYIRVCSLENRKINKLVKSNIERNLKLNKIIY